MTMPIKKVSDSTITTYKFAMPGDSNPSPDTKIMNINGGVILKLIDDIAGIVALRHCQTRVVTASIDAMEFLHPVRVGDLIILKSSVNWVGITSMEIGVRVDVEDIRTSEQKQVARAYLTFVAINREGKPIEAGKIQAVSDEEQIRYEEAKKRRELRLIHRNEIRSKLH